MIKILVTYDCSTKENRDAFYLALKELDMSNLCEKEEGCLGYKYYFPAEDDTKLLLTEIWESEDNLTLHKQQPHFIKMLALKEKMNIETSAV